jgi:hypothetical protein
MIRRVSTAALAARDEQARIAHLVALPGVSVATASAILTLIDPARYGVLDIRCWQLLFSLRSVAGNRRGRAFTLAQWEQYLTRLRGHARALGVSARTTVHAVPLPPAATSAAAPRLRPQAARTSDGTGEPAGAARRGRHRERASQPAARRSAR